MKIGKSLKGILFTVVLIILFVGSLFTLYKYDTTWSDQVNASVVVVASTEIKEGEALTNANTKKIKIKNKYIPMNYITGDSYINLDATRRINQGEILTSDDAEEDFLTLKDDQMIVALPDTWIQNLPDTLRRKDHLKLYLIKQVEVNSIQVAQPDTGVAVDQAKSLGESVSPENLTLINQSIENNTPILDDVVVAYFRDGSNGEVMSTDNPLGTNGSNDRLKGTSVAKKVEVVMTQKEVLLIKDAMALGYKLFIGYK